MAKMKRQYEMVYAPALGLRGDIPSTLIDTRACPNCQDVEFLGGYVRKRLGGVEFAGTVSAALNGKVMAIERVNGTLFVFTTTKVYKLTAGTFTDITVSAHTGDEDDEFSIAYMNDYLIFSNGVNTIKKYDFTNPVAALGGATDFRAKWMEQYGGRLILYNVTDSGTEFTRRVRYSKAGDCEDWISTGASYTDLDSQMKSDDYIQRAEKLGGYVIIYGKSSVVLQEYRGDVDIPFAYYSRLDGIGLLAPRAVANIEGNRHVFLTEDNIYEYTGGREVTPIGAPIRNELFNSISPEYSNRSFMSYRPESESIRIYIPTDGESTPNVCYQYNVSDKTWTSMTTTALSCGRHVVDSAPTWDSISQTWNAYGLSWNDRALIKLQPINLLGVSGGSVYQDDSDKNDAGTAINGWMDTKDFTSDPGYARTTTDWMQLTFEALGEGVDVYYSTDYGASFTLLEEVDLDSDLWDVYKVDFMFSSPQVRFRFRNSASNEGFKVRWFEVGYISSSDIAASVEEQ